MDLVAVICLMCTLEDCCQCQFYLFSQVTIVPDEKWMVVDGLGGCHLFCVYSGGLSLVSVLPVLSGNNCT